MCEKIVQIYGKKEMTSKEETELLEHAVKLIAFSSIISCRENFVSLFEDIIVSSTYNNDVKHSITRALKADRYLLDERLAGKSRNLYQINTEYTFYRNT